MSDGDRTVTLDDLREKALHVRDVAASEVRHLTQERATQVAIAGVVIALAALSLAYYLGTRRA